MTDRRSRFPGTRFLSRPAPAGFDVVFYVTDDRRIYAEIVFDASKEGGPGILHGGAIAAVLDEAMGVAAYEAGHAGYTITLTCNYKKHIPLGKPITVRARVDTIEGRRVFASSEATLPDGTIAVDATAIFIVSAELQRRLENKKTSQD